MYCIKCGTKLVDGAAFCQECGAGVEEEDVTNKELPVIAAHANKGTIIVNYSNRPKYVSEFSRSVPLFLCSIAWVVICFMLDFSSKEPFAVFMPYAEEDYFVMFLYPLFLALLTYTAASRSMKFTYIFILPYVAYLLFTRFVIHEELLSLTFNNAFEFFNFFGKIGILFVIAGCVNGTSVGMRKKKRNRLVTIACCAVFTAVLIALYCWAIGFFRKISYFGFMNYNFPSLGFSYPLNAFLENILVIPFALAFGFVFTVTEAKDKAVNGEV